MSSQELSNYEKYRGKCKEILESEATTDGRFAFCSSGCYGRFVGIY